MRITNQLFTTSPKLPFRILLIFGFFAPILLFFYLDYTLKFKPTFYWQSSFSVDYLSVSFQEFCPMLWFFLLCGSGLLLIGLIRAIYNGIKIVVKSHQISGQLYQAEYPSRERLDAILGELGIEIDVRLFHDHLLNNAFTIGFWQPKVFLSSGLYQRLTNGELRAILAHEAHHALTRDPLRLFITNFLRDLFFFLPIMHHLKTLFTFAREKEADDGAVKTGQNPLDLASALLKSLKSKNRTLAWQHLPGLKGDIFPEERIKRLVKPEMEVLPRMPGKLVFNSFMVIFFLVGTLFLSGYRARFPAWKCQGSHFSCPLSFHKMGSLMKGENISKP